MKVTIDAGQYWLVCSELSFAALPFGPDGGSVEVSPGFLFEVGDSIEGGANCAEANDPFLKRELDTEFSVNFLPGEEGRRFGIDDQAVEVEDERADLHSIPLL